MSALDFGTRAMAARLRRDTRRLSVIDRLSASIARSHTLPAVSANPPALSLSATTQIASGTLYGFNSGNAAQDWRRRYTLCGAYWNYYSATELHTVGTGHTGNGSDIAAAAFSSPNAKVRFSTWADRVEVLNAAEFGFRVLVNGEYVKTGTMGNKANEGFGSWWQYRYYLMDFSATPLAGKRKHIELVQCGNRFKGVRVPIAHTIEPWDAEGPLRMAWWGDSIAVLYSDSGDPYAALHGDSGHVLSVLTGQPDVWSLGVGGTGYVNDGAGTKSDFVERTAVDIVGRKFDVLIDIGGRNDYPGADGYDGAVEQAAVEGFIAACLADNPDMLLFLCGPMPRTGSEAWSLDARMRAVHEAKRAACAKYPKNCAFIETLGRSGIDDPWITGTGKQSAPAGNGNADRRVGPDGTHPTIAGNWELAAQVVSGVARVLPHLRSRIQNGVIAGINDIDLA